jgi:hypothetical protein
MKDFFVSAETLERARQITMGLARFDPKEFPVRILQYASKGPIHSLAPMNHEMVFPGGRREPFFRIFANGVFFHVIDTQNSLRLDLGNERWYLGNGDVLAVLGLKFKGSAQGDLVERVFSHYLKAD